MKRLATVLALGALTLAAACGGDDDTAAFGSSSTAAPGTTSAATESQVTGEPVDTRPVTTGSAPAATAEAPAAPGGPITISHVYGETVVDGVPQRIVSINLQWTDVLAALGHPPVAAVTDSVQGGWYPWQRTDGVEEIALTAVEIPYERIAAAEPDLIVGSWSVTDQAAYDLLTAIAPTIPLLDGEQQVEPWQDLATVAGELLGKPDEAAALISDAEQRSADLLAELPGLDGKTYALANYVPGDTIYVVADPDDGAAQVFAQIGLTIDPDLLEMPGAESGRVELSLERIGELDADVLLLLTNGADPSQIPGYEALPAVVSGAVSVMDYASVVGFNTPTPLSIPYSLEAIRPALEAAAAS